MHPQIKRQFRNVIRTTGVRPARALEVGGLTGPKSLLRFPELTGAERYCLNLAEQQPAPDITAVTGNANDMRGVFRSNWFDLVVCNATLEHDQRFWLSVAEMQRVLRPGGLLIIGVPGFVRDPERDRDKATLTYQVHYKFDYYRFSARAVREVFFAAMERVTVEAVMTPPRLIGHGYKREARRSRHSAGRAKRAVRRRLSRR